MLGIYLNTLALELADEKFIKILLQILREVQTDSLIDVTMSF